MILETPSLLLSNFSSTEVYIDGPVMGLDTLKMRKMSLNLISNYLD